MITTLQILTVIFAGLVAFSPNVLYSAVSLLLCLLGVALLYFTLHAEFLAAVQVIVYVGGITVVLIFAIMLTLAVYKVDARDYLKRLAPPLLLSFLLIAPPLFLLSRRVGFPLQSLSPAGPATVANLGTELLSRYLFAFELSTVLLLVALVGAVWMARK